MNAALCAWHSASFASVLQKDCLRKPAFEQSMARLNTVHLVHEDSASDLKWYCNITGDRVMYSEWFTWVLCYSKQCKMSTFPETWLNGMARMTSESEFTQHWTSISDFPGRLALNHKRSSQTVQYNLELYSLSLLLLLQDETYRSNTLLDTRTLVAIPNVLGISSQDDLRFGSFAAWLSSSCICRFGQLPSGLRQSQAVPR